MISQEGIRELAASIEGVRERAEEVGEELKAAFEAAKLKGLQPAALKAALKLKRMEPVKVRAWLDTLDRCRAAFGLDAQMDIEDGLKRGKRAAGNRDRKARKNKTPLNAPHSAITDSEGNVLARFGKPN
jgi:uncharacterized protein (UPF0335 family)